MINTQSYRIAHCHQYYHSGIQMHCKIRTYVCGCRCTIAYSHSYVGTCAAYTHVQTYSMHKGIPCFLVHARYVLNDNTFPQMKLNSENTANGETYSANSKENKG